MKVARVTRSLRSTTLRNTLVPARLAIQLLYEDETPMADAEFEAVFNKERVSGRTDKEGWAVIEPPIEQDTFLLVLREFPEQYVEPLDDAPSSKPAERGWPYTLLGMLAVAGLGVLLVTCAPAALRADRVAEALPPVATTLTGHLYRHADVVTMELSLVLDGATPHGTVRYGDVAPLTLRNTSLVVVDARRNGPFMTVRYRIRWATDRCEHHAPVPAGTTPTGWDDCFQEEGRDRPVRLEQTEAFLVRERMPGREAITAAGVTDVRTAGAVFRLTGSAAP